MLLEDARRILREAEHWNQGQTSISLAFRGVRTPEDDILDLRRRAIKEAWKVVLAAEAQVEEV